VNLNLDTGLIDKARLVASPNCDEREHHGEPEVIIIHSISLPPGEYGGGAVCDLFCNQLDVAADPYFTEIAHLRVSSHFFIRRDGELVQFVPTHLRAWHAGESVCLGKPKVNDFSLGIEMEGLDTGTDGFTESQYVTLAALVQQLIKAYPKLNKQTIFAHSDIAPARKTDPGPYFDWPTLMNALPEERKRSLLD